MDFSRQPVTVRNVKRTEPSNTMEILLRDFIEERISANHPYIGAAVPQLSALQQSAGPFVIAQYALTNQERRGAD